MNIFCRLQNGWNAFLNKDPTVVYKPQINTYSYRPDRARFSGRNERSIATSIYNRISMDAASIDIKHVRLDANDRYTEMMDSSLNN